MTYGPGTPAWEGEVKTLWRMRVPQLRSAYEVELSHSGKQIVYGLVNMNKSELIAAILEERKGRLIHEGNH